MAASVPVAPVKSATSIASTPEAALPLFCTYEE